MKKFTLYLAILCSISLFGQLQPIKNYSSFELGTGLNFGFNDSAYMFRISGMVQPYIAFSQMAEQDADYYFNAKRSYLNFSGMAAKEKVSFMFQLDFSLVDPLLDAYVSFHATKRFTITAGQKQNIANNREMLVMEDQLQFPDRSLLSADFSNSGREFGLFLDYRFGDSFGVVPQVSFTSGDGRNSFGTDSRDIDLGGFKYSARLDVYPLGYFTPGNEILVADLMHEKDFKFVIGAAASYNDGASEAVGEGHGDFFLYNLNGDLQQPDYRQVYGDILMKFRGFSLLGEYVVATATNLEDTYKAETGSELLMPTEISQYLALGTGYNVQVGYATTQGYALDFRYGASMPEFDKNVNSIIQDRNAWTVGLAKYFKGNTLKVAAAYSGISYANGKTSSLGEIILQVIF